jgi:hypothetical protein
MIAAMPREAAAMLNQMSFEMAALHDHCVLKSLYAVSKRDGHVKI